MDSITQVSRQLADHLAQGGVLLSPKPNSVFEPLVEGLLSVMPTETDDSETLRKQTNAALESLRPNPFTQSFEDDGEAPVMDIGVVYDEVEQRAVAELKPIVVGIVGELKNTVLPGVKAIFDKAYNTVAESVDTGSIKITVKTNHSEKLIWSNPILTSLLKQYSDGAGSEKVNSNLIFPDLGIDSLGAAIKTGNDQFDAEVSEFLAECDTTAALEHTFAEIFNPVIARSAQPQGQLVESVIALLMAVYFTADVPDGVTGVELDDYRLQLAKVATYHANHIRTAIASFRRNQDTGYMVIEMPGPGDVFNEGSAIIVDGVVYNRYLELGGGVDGIYGTYVTSGSRSMHLILEKYPTLERAWHNYVALAQSSVRDDFQRIFIGELRRHTNLYANDHALKVDGSVLEELYQRNISVDPANAYNFTRDYVIRSLWGDSEYLSLLRSIDGICAKYEEIEFDDAVELGIIEWLVTWAFSHIKIDHK